MPVKILIDKTAEKSLSKLIESSFNSLIFGFNVNTFIFGIVGNFLGNLFLEIILLKKIERRYKSEDAKYKG
jgi:hypothetical protein